MEQTPPLEDLDTSLSADIGQPMQQQVLSHESHPKVGCQRQHMHGQLWKLLCHVHLHGNLHGCNCSDPNQL